MTSNAPGTRCRTTEGVSGRMKIILFSPKRQATRNDPQQEYIFPRKKINKQTHSCKLHPSREMNIMFEEKYGI